MKDPIHDPSTHTAVFFVFGWFLPIFRSASFAFGEIEIKSNDTTRQLFSCLRQTNENHLVSTLLWHLSVSLIVSFQIPNENHLKKITQLTDADADEHHHYIVNYCSKISSLIDSNHATNSKDTQGWQIHHWGGAIQHCGRGQGCHCKWPIHNVIDLTFLIFLNSNSSSQQ